MPTLLIGTSEAPPCHERQHRYYYNTITTNFLFTECICTKHAKQHHMLAAPAGKDFANAMRTAQTCGLNMYNNIFYIPIANFHELVVY